MTEEEFLLIGQVARTFERAQEVCDPLDYATRQRNLMYAIGRYLSAAYREELKRQTEPQPQVTKTHDGWIVTTPDFKWVACPNDGFKPVKPHPRDLDEMRLDWLKTIVRTSHPYEDKAVESRPKPKDLYAIPPKLSTVEPFSAYPSTLDWPQFPSPNEPDQSSP